MGKKYTKQLKEEIALPQGVTASFDGVTMTLKGPKGESSKIVQSKQVHITVSGQTISLIGARPLKKDKMVLGSLTAHIKNLVRGVTNGYHYRLKICSGHFPMNVAVQKNEFVVKNFLGEKNPRILIIKPGAQVKIDGQEVVVEGTSKELCGQVSADIEKLTSIRGRDLRIFQDGIYIIEKDGKRIK